MRREDSISIKIRSIHHQISRYIDQRPLTCKIKKLTGTNAWLIMYIADQNEDGHDVYQKDIEDAFHVNRSTVSKVIGLMEQKNMVRRESVSHDARLKKMVLTEDALEIVQAIKDDSAQTEKKLMKGFTKEEKDMLFSYLDRLSANFKE